MVSVATKSKRNIYWFHIYWIPLFPYKIVFAKQCPICANSERINIQEAKELILMTLLRIDSKKKENYVALGKRYKL